MATNLTLPPRIIRPCPTALIMLADANNLTTRLKSETSRRVIVRIR